MLDYIRNPKWDYYQRVNNKGKNCGKVSTSFCPIGESKEHKFTIEKDFKVELLGKYLNFIKQEQYDIAGIEFVIGEDDVIYTYDVNANTNYNSEAEVIAGISAYDKLAKYLLTQL